MPNHCFPLIPPASCGGGGSEDLGQLTATHGETQRGLSSAAVAKDDDRGRVTRDPTIPLGHIVPSLHDRLIEENPDIGNEPNGPQRCHRDVETLSNAVLHSVP